MCYICSVYCLCIRPLVLSFLIWTNLVFGLMPPLHSPCLLFFSCFFFFFVCHVQSHATSPLLILCHLFWSVLVSLPCTGSHTLAYCFSLALSAMRPSVCCVYCVGCCWPSESLAQPSLFQSRCRQTHLPHQLIVHNLSPQQMPAQGTYLCVCSLSVTEAPHSQTHTCYLCAWSYVVGRLGGFALVRYG